MTGLVWGENVENFPSLVEGVTSVSGALQFRRNRGCASSDVCTFSEACMQGKRKEFSREIHVNKHDSS